MSSIIPPLPGVEESLHVDLAEYSPQGAWLHWPRQDAAVSLSPLDCFLGSHPELFSLWIWNSILLWDSLFVVKREGCCSPYQGPARVTFHWPGRHILWHSTRWHQCSFNMDFRDFHCQQQLLEIPRIKLTYLTKGWWTLKLKDKTH